MTEEGKWDSNGFDKLMKNSKNELSDLQNQQQKLMVKFCLRALEFIKLQDQNRSDLTKSLC